jgi:hypothetical protein
MRMLVLMKCERAQEIEGPAHTTQQQQADALHPSAPNSAATK